MKRKLIDEHKDFFLRNMDYNRLFFLPDEFKVARLYYEKGNTEYEISKKLKFPVKKVENLMIRACSRMILKKASTVRLEPRENWKETFKKKQSFYFKHKKIFKQELEKAKYNACVLRYEKEKTLDFIGKGMGVSKERVRQIIALASERIEKNISNRTD